MELFVVSKKLRIDVYNWISISLFLQFEIGIDIRALNPPYRWKIGSKFQTQYSHWETKGIYNVLIHQPFTSANHLQNSSKFIKESTSKITPLWCG